MSDLKSLQIKTNVLQRSAEMHGMAKLKYNAYYLENTLAYTFTQDDFQQLNRTTSFFIKIPCFTLFRFFTFSKYTLLVWFLSKCSQCCCARMPLQIPSTLQSLASTVRVKLQGTECQRARNSQLPFNHARKSRKYSYLREAFSIMRKAGKMGVYLDNMSQRSTTTKEEVTTLSQGDS